MIRVVSIQFTPAGKMYDFNAGTLDLKPGDRVLVETERGISLGIVVTGVIEKDASLCVHPLSLVQRLLEPDDEKTLAHHSRREKEAYDVCLRRIPLDAFRDALTGGSPAVHAVLSDVARAHRQQTELAVSRLSKDAEARCAEWLLRHAVNNDKGACSVQLQQRKRLIAAQLGIAPETLSRVLRHLRERSLISGSGRTVNLVDPSGLRSLAGV